MNTEAAPQFVLDLLSLRGISDRGEIEAFLYPKLATLPGPEKLLNAGQAAELVEFYLENQLQIVVWGDYDVDGTTATALLIHFFRQLGSEVLWHIPDRFSDGYGLNVRWFEQNRSRFHSQRFLLVTVDTGISSKEEIARIQQMGGDVIVTDHHAIPQTGLPDCIVINPEQKGCGFGGEKIAGVGIAFYLAAAIRAGLSRNSNFQHVKNINLKQFLAFVALGTVADMVELTATNRVLVRAGMEELGKPGFLGVTALLEVSGIYGGTISTEDIGFLVGPRLNAAGRLGSSRLGVEVLIAENSEIAAEKAEMLNRLNDKRKHLTRVDTEKALLQLSSYKVEQEKICVVYGDFHLGVAGIVASRLVEKFGVPALVLGQGCLGETKVYTGSGRSVEGIDLIGAIQECGDLLERYGGHRMAAGLTVSHKNIEKFIANIGEKVRAALKSINQEQRGVRARYDLDCSIDDIMSKEALRYFSLLEPFGPGNPQPVFYDKDAVVVAAKTVGRQAEHINITFRGRYSSYKGIGFGLGHQLDELQEHSRRRLIYSLSRNRFRGTVSWQVQVQSI